jgi:hypothetical protein
MKAFRWAMVVVTLVGTFAAAAALPVRSSRLARATGDEPHYLLTAMSIAEDRSLDISDEHAARRYLPFHERNLKPQGKALEDGRLLSPHEPMLPALLAVPFAVGGWVGARVALAVLAGALAGLLLWTAVRRFDVPLGPAVVAVAVFAGSAPIAVYGSQIYPEMPAALALTAGLIVLTGPLGNWGLAGLASSVVLLAWLGTKFIPVAAVLAAIGLIRLVKAGMSRQSLALTAVLALAGIGYLGAHRAWYGGFTPYAVGAVNAPGGDLSVIGENPGLLWGRSLRLIGLLVDRSFGLAAWQPAWLLVIPALAFILRRRPVGWEVLFWTLLAGWLTAAFIALTMHGWWWPGRQLVVVLPAAVLIIARWAGTSRWATRLTAVLGIVGSITYVWILAEGWRTKITFAIDFAETANPVYRLWSTLLPDYTAISGSTWVRHVLWVAAAGLLMAAGAGWMATLRQRNGPLATTSAR